MGERRTPPRVLRHLRGIFSGQITGEQPLLVLAGVVLAGLATGWFLLSLLVAHHDVRTAVRETLGVGLGLLVLMSALGAHRDGARHRHGDE